MGVALFGVKVAVEIETLDKIDSKGVNDITEINIYYPLISYPYGFCVMNVMAM